MSLPPCPDCAKPPVPGIDYQWSKSRHFAYQRKGHNEPEPCRLEVWGLPDRRIYQLNTSINNPLQEDCHEIEVTNPTHPLFGRRFPLLFVSRPPHGTPNAFVSYQKYMVLKIPVHDTNLFENHSTLFTKLTLQAINEFISIAKECKELCHISQNIYGMDCQFKSKNK